MARARLYKQTGAIFWSDDYTAGEPPLGPRGQYFSGDRELSPFWSWLLGLRVVWRVDPSQGRLWGVIETVKVVGSVSVVSFSYDAYTLGGAPVTDARAYLAGATLSAAF